MRTRRFVLVLLLVLLTVGCDQLSKAIVKSVLPREGTVSLGADRVTLHYAENKGAVLSFES